MSLTTINLNLLSGNTAGQVIGDTANKNVLKLVPSGNIQSTSGQLTDKYFAGITANTTQVLWNLGLTSGNSQVAFEFTIVGNQNGTSSQTKYKVNASATGSAANTNTVVAMIPSSQSIVVQDDTTWSYNVSVAVANSFMTVAVTPNTGNNVGNFQAIGTWQASYIGNGGTIVYEN